MVNFSGIQNMIEEKLMSVHTAYIAKVLEYADGKATVQPLTLSRQYGREAAQPPIIRGVPVVASARYWVAGLEQRACAKSVTGGSTSCTLNTEERPHAKIQELTAGALVVCVCGERDISSARYDRMALPARRRHSLSDTIVVGVLA